MQVQCPDGQMTSVMVPADAQPGTMVQVTVPPPGTMAPSYPAYPPVGEGQPQQQPMNGCAEFLHRELFKIGPITVTPRRLIPFIVFIIFGTMMIVNITTGGLGGDGDGSSGGGGGGSFVAGTRVKMADGKWHCIEKIRIGDQLALGGRVIARMEFEADLQDLYEYPINATGTSADGLSAGGGLLVAGRHAVWENKRWRRVRGSAKAQQIDRDSFQALLLEGERSVRVFDVDVEKHRLLVRPALDSAHNAGRCVPEPLEAEDGIVFADFSEVDVLHPVNERCDVELLQALEPWSGAEI